MTLLIRNGTIIDPSQKLKKKSDIVVDRGKVVGLGKIKPKKSWQIVDASGCFVVPGFIDTHVHPESTIARSGGEDERAIYQWAPGIHTAVLLQDTAAATLFPELRVRCPWR